jgi:enoyl-CoA hydratase/carnithine racemase
VGWEIRPAGGTRDRFIGTITLQSPKTYNALTVDMGRRFQALCRELADDITSGSKHVDAIILTGQGNDAFSAGGVLDWLKTLNKKSPHANADLMVQFYKYFLAIRSIPVPVIAALHGPAMGAGAGLALGKYSLSKVCCVSPTDASLFSKSFVSRSLRPSNSGAQSKNTWTSFHAARHT